MVAQEIIMIRTLIKALRHAHRAVIRLNRAERPDQRNIQLRHLGSSLIIIGVISVAVMMTAIVLPSEKIFAYPTYIHVILSVVLDFIALSGFSGITVGMFLLTINNPWQYGCLAMIVLWVSSVAASCVIGILLMASFSPS